MGFRAGDIALVSMRTSDGGSKNRPALLLCQFPPFGDWLVAGISSKLYQTVPEFDYALIAGAMYFPNTGLKSSSVIRLGYLATVAENMMPGVLDKVPFDILKTSIERITERLRAQITAE